MKSILGIFAIGVLLALVLLPSMVAGAWVFSWFN